MAIQRRVNNDDQNEFDTKEKEAVKNETDSSSATFESLKETMMSLSDKIEKNNAAIASMKLQNM